MNHNILYVSPSDDFDFETLNAALSDSGFSLTHVPSADQARKHFEERGLPHLLVVDLRLPEGLQLCEEMNRLAGLPIIAVASDDASQEQALMALRCADDYVRRAFFSPEELALRIRRILTRVQNFSYASGPTVAITDWLSFSPAHSRVTVHGEVRKLTPIENAILQVLLAHRGQPVDANILLERVWHAGEIKEDKNALRVHVHRLRQKIEADPDKPRLILTERSQGYTLSGS